MELLALILQRVFFILVMNQVEFYCHLGQLLVKCLIIYNLFQLKFRGARWCSGRGSDSELRDPGFDPHPGCTVLCPWARHLNPQEYWFIPRKR